MPTVMKPPTRPWKTSKRQRLNASRKFLATVAADLLAFVIALATPFSVKLVGSLPVAEILVLPLAPVFVIFRRHRPISPVLKAIFFLMGLWLFGQVITDLYRHTAAVDWMRGDAAIVFFGFDLAFLNAFLGGNERRKIVFIAGLAIAGLLSARFAPSRFAQGEPWKFGYSDGTILLIILISCFFYRQQKYFMVCALFAGLIAINLIENYRSPVLNLLVAMVLVVPVIPSRIGRLKLLPRSGSLGRVAVLAALALAGAWLASTLVHWVTSAGIIGQEAQVKNEQEIQGAGGVLLGGRPEILVSSRAVMDSPILGYGSWARDYRYVEMLNDLLIEQGKSSNLQGLTEASEDLIPAHSHLMGAWVWAGILGAVFWAFLLWWVLKGIVKVSMLRPPMAPLYAYLLVSYFWAILFSPFGSTLRIGESLIIVVMLDLVTARFAAHVPAQKRTAGRPSLRRLNRPPLRLVRSVR